MCNCPVAWRATSCRSQRVPGVVQFTSQLSNDATSVQSAFLHFHSSSSLLWMSGSILCSAEPYLRQLRRLPEHHHDLPRGPKRRVHYTHGMTSRRLIRIKVLASSFFVNRMRATSFLCRLRAAVVKEPSNANGLHQGQFHTSERRYGNERKRLIYRSSIQLRQPCAGTVLSLSTISSEVAVFPQVLQVFKSRKKASGDKCDTLSSYSPAPASTLVPARMPERNPIYYVPPLTYSRSRRPPYSLNFLALSIVRPSEELWLPTRTSSAQYPPFRSPRRGTCSRSTLQMQQARQKHSLSRADM
jgi:hypothetical protein